MSVSEQSPDGPGPYEKAALGYFSAGWRGVLPLPARQKWPPPEGFTGSHGWPSGADIYDWVAECGDSNICLRLPDGVIGIDVDAYGAKRGRASLNEAFQKYGPLPTTWRSTSRDDGLSGIYLYATPLGLAWPSQVGADIEIIRQGHRYAVCWPSIHPEGRTYRWINPAGVIVATGWPDVADLPSMPSAWVEGLTGGRAAPAEAERRAVTAALLGSLMDAGPMCRVMRHVLSEGCTRLAGPGSRHDKAMVVLMHLFRLRAEGHSGLRSAVEVYWQCWSTAVRRPGDGQRDDMMAEREWRDLITGAAALVPEPVAVDPCADDLAGILAPGWQEWTPPPATGPERVSPGAAPAGIGDPPSGGGAEATLGDNDTRQQLIQIEAERLRIRLEAREIVEAERNRAWQPPPYGSVTDVLATPSEPVIWAVADVLPEGGNVLLTAGFKSGKTTLVNHLAQCMADAQPFMAEYAVDDGDHRVALWNYEVSATMYKRWLTDLGIKNTDSVHVANIRGFTMPIMVPRVEDWTVEWLKSRGITTWVVDPFARAFTGNGENENSNTDVGLFLDRLDRIKERAGVGQLIVPTHTGRAVADVGAERARGATRLDDWCDVRWMLTTQADDNGSEHRYFRATGRDVETPEAQVVMDPITRRLSLASGKRERTSGRKPARNLTSEARAFVADHPGASGRDVRNALRAAPQSVLDALAALVSQGLIRADAAPHRGFAYYNEESPA